jgi:hypothetical protein
MGWATFWAIFSKQHLVTLIETVRLKRISADNKWRDK